MTSLTPARLILCALTIVCTSSCGDDKVAPATNLQDVDMSMVPKDMRSLPADQAPPIKMDMPSGDQGKDGAEDTRFVAQNGLQGPCEGSERRVRPLEEAEEVSWATFNAKALEFGHLEVRDGASNLKFETAKGFALLEAAAHKPKVEEKQGSFKIEASSPTLLCTRPRDTKAFVSDKGSLLIQGGFADGGRQCDRLEFEIQVCEKSAHRLGVAVRTNLPEVFDHLTIHAAATPDQKVYGAGQQFVHRSLDLRGRRLPILSQEGGVGRGHPVISPAVNLASSGSGGSEEATYYAAAHYMTDSGQALLLENSALSFLDFTDDTAHRLEVFDSSLDAQILAGSTPLELLESLTEYTGRMPEPPGWLDQGAILALARDLPQSEQIVTDLLDRGARIAAVWNQTWSGISKTFIGEQVLWHWIQNPGAHPGWGEFVAKMQQRDIRTLCYVNPMFRELPPEELRRMPRRNLYDEAKEGGYFVKNEAGNPYKMPVTAFDVFLLDLTHEAARTWMKAILKEEMIKRAGCAGWMADFAEALPFDAVLSDGSPAPLYHNRYPVEWAKLNREALEEAGVVGQVLVFNRSGALRTPAYSTMLWQGDQLTTWDAYDGIQSALYALLGGGISGIALNHSDTGGYTSLSRWGLGYTRESELLKRWTEMNAFTSVLRTHEGNQPQANAQVYSDDTARDHFARFTKVYAALAPYRRTLFAQASQKGWPVVRHMLLEFPQDPKAWELDDQFMLGSEFLIAPILKKCGSEKNCNPERSLYLPKGRWVHLWSQKSYGDAGKGMQVELRVPIGEPAVFYKQGSQAGIELNQELKTLGILRD